MDLKDTTFFDYTFKKGVILLAFPQYGIYMLRPAMAAGFNYIIATPPHGNTDVGGYSVDAYMPGTLVYFSPHNNNPSKAFIIAPVPKLGFRLDPYALYRHVAPNTKNFDSMDIKDLNQIFWKAMNLSTNSKNNINTITVEDEVKPGDILFKDASGTSFLIGRSVITVKGSESAYTLLSGITSKITNVADTFLIDTFDSAISFSTGINKVLKAKNIEESLGILSLKDMLSYKIEKDKVIKALYIDIDSETLLNKLPLYRYQLFTGADLVGDFKTLLVPVLNKLKTEYCTAYQLYINKDGASSKISAKNIRNIKTLTNKGLIQKLLSLEQLLKIQDVDKEAKAILLESTYITDPVINSIKSIVLDALLKTPLSKLLELTVYDKQALDNINRQDITLGTSLFLFLLFQNNKIKASEISQEIPPKDSLAGHFNATSFITQEEDGSIFIKDGWGSLIRMTGGNIYISSALDTFILPGRDVVLMIPRNKDITTNGTIQIVSSKKTMIGSALDIVITSAISGGTGFTVILNKSFKLNQDNAGIILRSNSNLLLTASKDLYIGLNDKTLKNAKDKITRGKGNIFILGYNISLDAVNALKTTTSAIGLYSYIDSIGSGIEIKPGGVSIVTPQTQIASGILEIGATDKTYKTYKGFSLDILYLDNGSSLSTNVKVDGVLNAKEMRLNGNLIATGSIHGNYYRVLHEGTQDVIYGMKEKDAKELRNSIYKIFSEPIKGLEGLLLKALAPWYNDDYICTHEAYFNSSEDLSFSRDFVFPQMCWQLLPLELISVFNFIYTNKTGTALYSYSYPGKDAVLYGKIVTFENNKISRNKNLVDSYITNKQKE